MYILMYILMYKKGDPYILMYKKEDPLVQIMYILMYKCVEQYANASNK